MDEPKSIKKCCEKTLHVIKEKQKQNINKLKSACSQTELINKIELKNNEKGLSQSGMIYTTDQKLKPFSYKNSISYDIIFKPSLKCSKGINTVRFN